MSDREPGAVLGPVEVGPVEVGPVEVGPVAHGGHCVARLPPADAGEPNGRVIFVRHALPGERVRVRLTDTTHERYWRADAIEVLTASPDRVTPPCPAAGPGRCGGCDFQHVALPAQRQLKAAVVAEQLRRLAALTWSGEVEAVGLGSEPETLADDGLGWRTRMRYHVDATGRAGLRRSRSHAIEPVPSPGPLAHPAVPAVTEAGWPPGAEVLAAGNAAGSRLVVGPVPTDEPRLVERAAGRRWEVAVDGFWQVHAGAADLLTRVVAEALSPQAGERAFDLYCGVGLFAGTLADSGAHVWAVESDRASAAAARDNLADVADRVRVLSGRVGQVLARLPRRCDLVVLDPPRTGAGAAVMRAMLDRHPRAVAYVACDPAALARDLATAADAGYSATSIRAFDLFPMTAHVECVAVLHPDSH